MTREELFALAFYRANDALQKNASLSREAFRQIQNVGLDADAEVDALALTFLRDAADALSE